MGTVLDKQGLGAGARLLSTALSELGKRGIKRSFLGATPAGIKMYENLGYRTVFNTNVWALGETHQT